MTRRRELTLDEAEKVRQIFVDHFRRSQATKPEMANETQILFPQEAGGGSDPGKSVLASRVPLIRPKLVSKIDEEKLTGFVNGFLLASGKF